MSFIRCGTLKEDFIWSKVNTWVSVVGVFAKLTVQYPQDICMGYTLCLQYKWQYLCRCMPDIAHLLEPLERALREELLPAFLCVDLEDINNEFRELLAGKEDWESVVMWPQRRNSTAHPLMCVVI